MEELMLYRDFPGTVYEKHITVILEIIQWCMISSLQSWRLEFVQNLWEKEPCNPRK